MSSVPVAAANVIVRPHEPPTSSRTTGTPSSASSRRDSSTLRPPIEPRPSSSTGNMRAPPTSHACRAERRAPRDSTPAISSGIAESAYFPGGSPARRQNGSITCASPATLRSRSRTMTPTHEPRVVLSRAPSCA